MASVPPAGWVIAVIVQVPQMSLARASIASPVAFGATPTVSSTARGATDTVTTASVVWPFFVTSYVNVVVPEKVGGGT